MSFTPADFWPPGPPPTGGAATDQTARDAAAAAQSTANAAVSTGAELAPLLVDPASTMKRPGADVSRTLAALVSEVYARDDFASFANQLTEAKARTARFYNTDRAAFSAAGSGWRRIKLGPGVYTESVAQSPTSCIGLVIEGEGMELTTLVFTGTSGDFLTLNTPIMVVIKNLTVINGSVATASGKVQTTIYPVEGGSPQSTARFLVLNNASGATKYLLENVAIFGFADQVVIPGAANGDNLTSLNGFYKWCNRHLVLSNAQAILNKYLATKFQIIYDAAIDVVAGGHVHVDGAEVIIPGTFVRIAAMNDGQSACVLRNVHHEGYQNTDPTSTPRIVHVTGGGPGEIVLDNYEAWSAWNAASDCITVAAGTLNITATNSTFAARANLTPSSFAATASGENAATFRQLRCRRPIAPASITKGVQAADGSSRYRLTWEGCGGVPDHAIAGTTGGSFTVRPTVNVHYRTGTGTAVRRLQASGGPNPETIASYGYFEKQRVRGAWVLTGSAVGNGGATAQLYADAGLTQAVGSAATLAAANTLYDLAVPATTLGLQFWLKVTSSVAQDVLGEFRLELEPCALVNP